MRHAVVVPLSPGRGRCFSLGSGAVKQIQDTKEDEETEEPTRKRHKPLMIPHFKPAEQRDGRLGLGQFLIPSSRRRLFAHRHK